MFDAARDARDPNSIRDIETPTETLQSLERPPPAMSRGECTMRRVLAIPAGRPVAGEDQAHRLFSVSIALSATRCLATYILLPVVTPLIGPSTGTGPAVGIPLSILALIFDVRALRRFWLADHRWRWKMTVLYGLLMLLVTGLLAWDIARLTG